MTVKDNSKAFVVSSVSMECGLLPAQEFGVGKSRFLLAQKWLIN